jgi:hypothetical protein
MDVLHPVVLGPHQSGDAGRRNATQHLVARDAERLQIVENPVVVAALFRDVPLEVRDQQHGDRVVRERSGCRQRGLQQRHARPDDAVPQDQELWIDPLEFRMAHDPTAGCQHRG